MESGRLTIAVSSIRISLKHFIFLMSSGNSYSFQQPERLRGCLVTENVFHFQNVDKKEVNCREGVKEVILMALLPFLPLGFGLPWL